MPPDEGQPGSPEGDMEKPAAIEEAAELTDYAVMSRYPAAAEPVDDVEHRKAL